MEAVDGHEHATWSIGNAWCLVQQFSSSPDGVGNEGTRQEIDDENVMQESHTLFLDYIKESKTEDLGKDDPLV
ncbi:hypothetical protein NDU88_004763 [Pleurodeles waltl]|uniref:Uncharacterized protein n=1 Tax=Pleurodeles waltl TaxID=8319 RepID=A0AAV7MAU3_PLEWA|nr:hypothetical protein NDU88_004763 [Pleurodeles waltl]